MIIKDDFERNSVLGDLWYKEYPNNSYNATISKQKSRSGKRSLRMELRNTDEIVYSSKRSEVTFKQKAPPTGYCIYKFSIFLPTGSEDYALDPRGSELIYQWHNTPDTGEEWTYPPLAMHTGAYMNKADHYTLESYYDASALSTDTSMELSRAVWDLGSFTRDKGKWVDWEYRIKWGWLPEHTPSIVVIKNGTLVLNVKRPNMTNDQQGVYFKMGIYKWDWAQPNYANSTVTKRIIYYDAVSVGYY